MINKGSIFLFLTLSSAAMADGGGSFSVYDKDQDGYLSRTEYSVYLNAQSRRNREDPEQVFDAVDTDNDDRVSGEEMVNILQERLKRRLNKRM